MVQCSTSETAPRDNDSEQETREVLLSIQIEQVQNEVLTSRSEFLFWTPSQRSQQKKDLGTVATRDEKEESG